MDMYTDKNCADVQYLYIYMNILETIWISWLLSRCHDAK